MSNMHRISENDEHGTTYYFANFCLIQMLETAVGDSCIKFMTWGRPCADPKIFKSYSQSKPTGVFDSSASLKVVHSVTVSEQKCGCRAACQ